MSRETHDRICERLRTLSSVDSTNSVDTAQVVGVELRWNGKGQDSYPCPLTIQITKTEAVLG